MIGLGFIQAQDIDQNLGLITVTQSSDRLPVFLLPYGPSEVYSPICTG